MHSMIRHLILSIALLPILFFLMGGCGLNPFSSGEVQYRIQHIQGLPPLQEIIDSQGGSGGYTIPLLIKFSTMPPGHSFQGSVMLTNIGWQPIENQSQNKDSFQVALGEGNSEYFIFSHLEIQDNMLSGKVIIAGPAIDGIWSNFTAIRQ